MPEEHAGQPPSELDEIDERRRRLAAAGCRSPALEKRRERVLARERAFKRKASTPQGRKNLDRAARAMAAAAGHEQARTGHESPFKRMALHAADALSRATRVQRAIVAIDTSRHRRASGPAPARRQGSRRATGTGSRAGPSSDGESDPPGVAAAPPAGGETAEPGRITRRSLAGRIIRRLWGWWR